MPARPLPANKTKIICTIGPASQSQEMLEQLIKAGMNVARINFAHGDRASHRKTIDNIRSAAAALDRQVAIMGDLPGPKIRIGRLKNDSAHLVRGQRFTLLAKETVGDNSHVSVSFPDLLKVVGPGDTIRIRDGYIELEVEEVEKLKVHCRVLVGGEIRSNNGVNIPGVDLQINAFTKEDARWLTFASEQELDAVSQSFAQSASDIMAVRKAARSLDYDPFIIAKIERSRAVDNFDEILEESDGIMIARGDLGVEIPIEEIAIVQKHIITKVQLLAKPVITATQMLESMIKQPRPTRAEATDVANAILDGTDCLMLSGETAIGNYAVEAVQLMVRIAHVAEPFIEPPDVSTLLESTRASHDTDRERLLSLSIFHSVQTVSPVAVVTPTLSGDTARLLARFRLPVWIIASSPNLSTCRQLHFSYGVEAHHTATRPPVWDAFARKLLSDRSIDSGVALLTYGTGTTSGQITSRIEFIDLEVPHSESATWVPTR